MSTTEPSTNIPSAPTPIKVAPGREKSAPEAGAATQEEEYPYLPPIIQQGIRAFERERPRLREELLLQGYTEKEWIAFHGDRYLGHARKQYDLLQKFCSEEGIPDDEIYCHPLFPPIRHVYVFRSDIVG